MNSSIYVSNRFLKIQSQISKAYHLTVSWETKGLKLIEFSLSRDN